MRILLDSNVLLRLIEPSHFHYQSSARRNLSFATAWLQTHHRSASGLRILVTRPLAVRLRAVPYIAPAGPLVANLLGARLNRLLSYLIIDKTVPVMDAILFFK